MTEGKNYSAVTVMLGGKQFSAQLGGMHPFYAALAASVYTPSWDSLRRLRSGNWDADLVHSIIRAGLIGAGRGFADADSIMRGHVADRPLIEAVPAAITILATYLIGEVSEEQESA